MPSDLLALIASRQDVADYQKMVAQLRDAKIRAELYLGNPKNMGNQLKYADRRNSPCVIIQGSDEKARGEIQRQADAAMRGRTPEGLDGGGAVAGLEIPPASGACPGSLPR